MILKDILIFLLLISSLAGQGQLVRKRDYDAAFALQAGIGSGIAVPGKPEEMKIDGIYGLKMTFPFNRKWFLGAEVNYNPLHFANEKTFSSPQGDPVTSKLDIDLQTLNVPVYVKYLLRNNRTGLLLGGYFSRHLKSEFKFSDGNGISGFPDEYEAGTEKWDAGITAGVEQKLLKHLNLLFRVSGSLKSITGKEAGLHPENTFPLQAHLTLSYDILRIGDCGCD